jgi:hypothetical protein
MKTLPIPSLALGVCLLALSAGVAFADNLHNPAETGGPPSTATSGQTGTQAPGSSKPTIAQCGSGGVVPGGAKTNNGNGSPFNTAVVMGLATKSYAGSVGNSGSNPNANSQYDNACAQAQLH